MKLFTLCICAYYFGLTIGLTRHDVIDRAENWCFKGITYSEKEDFKFPGKIYKDEEIKEYNPTGLGFLSMAWNLPQSYGVPQIFDFTERITTSQLEKGDALIKERREILIGKVNVTSHAVVFKEWADPYNTTYYGYELINNGIFSVQCNSKIVYPYKTEFDEHLFKPFRLNTIKNDHEEDDEEEDDEEDED